MAEHEFFVRVEDFINYYANNVQFEASSFDLKVIFGQLQQTHGTQVLQECAVTVPWIQAKLAWFYLQLQVEMFELQNGKIQIPKDLLPPEPPEATAEQKKQFPQAEEMVAILKKLRSDFMAKL